MDVKVCLFLFVLGASWCCNAREMATSDLIHKDTEVVSVMPVNNQQSLFEVSKDEKVCTLCKEFAAEALLYLANNKTQTEIIEILHKSCSKMLISKQCITLVDYYAPLFFLEVSTIQPGEFCQKVGLCKIAISPSHHLPKNSCDLCHNVMTQALLKLKDPDTQLEIIQVLLKACGAVKGYVKKCKRMVFEFAPVIFINAEQFLETNDICQLLHACDSSAAALDQDLPGTETFMRSAF